MENQAARDRERLQAGIDDTRREVDAHPARLSASDDDIRELARSIAVSTVKLQLWGLLLVGAGTVLMALPTIHSLWSALP